MNLNFIVPDINMTFGDMKFMGLNRERYVYDRENNKRTDVLNLGFITLLVLSKVVKLK